MYKLINILILVGCVVWLYLQPGIEPIIVFLAGVAAFFRDEVQGIVGAKFISLTQKSKLLRDIRNSKYSFVCENYINPAILEDLSGWISDSGDEIVSISITGANNSNRYFGEVTVNQNENEYPWVFYEHEETKLAYKYIGCSFSGVHLVQLSSNYGGSGIFCSVLLVTIAFEPNICFERNDSAEIKERIVIKRIGSIALGDRYDEELKYKYGFLTIPKCSGLKTLRQKTSRIFII